jgi:NAD(P)-dependent dehydrogenase (short-subunit alcohol dehydrogenase family)
MTKRLDGKVAIITGAGCVGPGWGNGRATTYRFIEEGNAYLRRYSEPIGLKYDSCLHKTFWPA